MRIWPENVQNITHSTGARRRWFHSTGRRARSLDGVLVIRPDRVWSPLLSGNTDWCVKAQRAAFRAFLDSIQWQD